MATTRFVLDSRRATNNQGVQLKVAISHKTKTAYISLNIKINPEKEWDPIKGIVINHPQKAVINTYINRVKTQIDSILLNLLNEGKLSALSTPELKRICELEIFPDKKERHMKEQDVQTSFLFRFMKYAESMRPGSRRTFDHTLNRLTAFLDDEEALKKLRFEDITPEWLTRFDSFMSKTAPSRNSRNIHFRNIRTVVNAALADNITTNYPFRRFKIKNEITAHRNLTAEELRQLIFFDCEECAVKYRDYFMLMFYLMGINNTDLCHLKEINRGRIEFHRAKTRHFFSMKIEPEAMEIIDRYRGQQWLLDILDRWESDTFFRQKMNRHLQRIGPVTRSGLGGKKTYKPLFPKLTTYYARHSWASIASSLDIPIETIAAGLGHEYGNPVTAIYIHFDNRKVDIANRKVIDWVLYGKIDGNVVCQPGTPEFFGLTPTKAAELGLCPILHSTPIEEDCKSSD